MLFALGMYVFELKTLAPETLNRKSEYGYATNSRIGARDAAQFIGSNETVSLTGTVYAEIVNDLAAAQNQQLTLKQRVKNMLHSSISKSSISDFLTGRQDQHNQSAEIVSIDTLRQMADQGQSWQLVDGNGKVYGAYIITGITEDMKVFWPDGRPRQIDFTIELKRVDPEQNNQTVTTVSYA